MVKRKVSHKSTSIDTEEKKDIDLSGAVLDKLKTSFDSFDKIDEDKRIDLYGDKDLILQFRDHFKKMNPNLLDQIDQNDLPVYLQALEKKGFKLGNLKEESKILKEEIGETETEITVIKSSLGKLKDFCGASINKIPPHIFNDFATEAKFSASPLNIDATSDIRSIDDLWKIWKQFAETKNVLVDGQNMKLSDFHTENIANILCPDYNPTERIVVQIAVEKIRKLLPAPLKVDFDLMFPLPIDAHSMMTSLDSFKTSWQLFLDTHEAQIDEPLRKKLDDTIVTNGDIKNAFIRSGHDFDDSVSFSHWEKRFRRVFNKLATRQLFEEVRSTSAAVEKYVDNITDAFVQFPPYVNQVFSKYPYNPRNISTVDTEFDKDIVKFDSQLNSLEAQIAAETDKEKKKDFKKKKSELKKQKEMRKRQAYTKWLESKNSKLSSVIAKLAQNNFDFNKLDSVQQQEIINILVQSKLDDLTKNKVPELLKIDQDDFSKFVRDLFDLNKKQILIPTKTGNYPINFESKSFISSDLSSFFSVDSLGELENLPLNFKIKVDESNRDFFEKSPLFDHLFQDFDSKKGTEKISDSYKVRIKKGDKSPEGYLSAYPPPINMDELVNNGKFSKKNNQNGEEEETDLKTSDYLFLYSSPISSADQNRELVVDDKGNPIFFPKDKEGDYELEVLDRKINLAGKSINSLLMAYVLGQDSMEKDLSSATEKKLGEKFKNIKGFLDSTNNESSDSDKTKEDDEKKEKSDYEKCIVEREKIQGYKFPSDPKLSPEKDPKGFVEGNSFLIDFGSSSLPPGTGQKFIKAEIIKIDKGTGKFTLKFSGGEAKLGKYEGHKQEFSLSADGIDQFKEMFGSGEIYKLPDAKKYRGNLDEYISILSQSGFESDINKSFGNIKWKGDKFQFTTGDYIGQDVEYFGWYESRVGEVDDEQGNMYLYKIKHNPNGTINVSSQFKDNKENVKYSKDMDYDTFISFIASKNLQPKSKEQSDAIKKKNHEGVDSGAKDKIPFFSINNVLGFFKNIPGKVKDGMKKYDEEKTEDLTDMIVQKNRLYKKLSNLMPSSRRAYAFENMDVEYNADRDNRIWKKIDKRLKIYEGDPHFATQCSKVFAGMMSGDTVVKDRYKLAAMLLATIKKGKGPYNRNADMVGKGLWIRSLFGAEHQARYLKIREMKQRDLQEKASINPQQWADQTQDELVELEMKYIVHVADGRQMAFDPKNGTEETYLAEKWSRQFSGKLDEYYNEHFRKSTVEEGYNKIPKTTNFEFARFEYFRLVSERPMQAIPYLKVMAEKALTERDWRIFEKGVVGLMLSGISLYMIQSDVKSFIQEVCRTRGFLPGLWIRDVNQQSKLIRLLDIAAGGKFDSKYTINKFAMGNLDKKGVNSTKDLINTRILEYKDGDWAKISNFLSLSGKNSQGKTLIEVYNDPKTSGEDKRLLREIISKGTEKDEKIDQQVKDNSKALTGSVLTKSQSVVDELIRFEGGEFKGKDKDTIQAMQDFWSEVSKRIPKTKETSDSVEFFLKKFENWFGARGFSDNERSVFIRRLAAIKNCSNKKEAEDMLWYTIVGTITARSGSGGIPSQLLAGLDAFKDFFKSNLDTILQPDVIEKVFGIQYRDDVNNAYEVGNWSDYAEVADRDLYQSMIFSASPDERKRINEIKKKLSLSQYIHKDLYELAQKLEKNFGIPNRFKNYSQEKTNTKKDLTSALLPNHGVRIKNKEVLGKIKDVLENKDKGTGLSDDQMIIGSDDYDEYYSDAA